MDQRIINLYDEYTHLPLSRTEFIQRLSKLTGSVTAAMAILPALEVNYAKAITISEQDDAIVSESISYPTPHTTMKGYFSRPAIAGNYGSVLVIHENRGLNPHIRDVTRRVAKAGYLALAPDALSVAGGTPEDPDKARDLFGSLDAAKTRDNFLAGLEYLKKHEFSNGKLATVGFCWGGAMVGQLAVHAPDLKLAVAFYGRQPAAEDVKNIRAQLQLHYAEQDERVNAGIAEFETALKKEKIRYELFMYPGAQHAFHNDTAPTRYNEKAAALAWERTLSAFAATIR